MVILSEIKEHISYLFKSQIVIELFEKTLNKIKTVKLSKIVLRSKRSNIFLVIFV